MSNTENGNTPIDCVWVTHHDIYEDHPYLDNVSEKPWDVDYDAPVTRTHDNIKYRRDDLPLTTAQLMADERVRALVEVVRVQSNLLLSGATGHRGYVIGRRLNEALAQLKEPVK